MEIFNGAGAICFGRLEQAHQIDEVVTWANKAPEHILFLDSARSAPDLLEALAAHPRATEVRRLQTLNLWPDLSPLQGLIGLESIGIGHENSRFDFSLLQCLRKAGGVWSDGFVGLERCDCLTSFHFSNYSGSIGEIPRLSALEELSLIMPRCRTLDGIQYAQALKSLTFIMARQLVGIEALRELTGLEHITFENCRRINDYSPLRGLVNLLEVRITDCATLPGVQLFSNSGLLQKLNLYGTALHDTDLTHALDFPDLVLFVIEEKPKGKFNPRLAKIEAALKARAAQHHNDDAG